jgi:hypothetical protein
MATAKPAGNGAPNGHFFSANNALDIFNHGVANLLCGLDANRQTIGFFHKWLASWDQR